jgi:glycosyltransferase involved in cell wall biosynthesis
MRIALLTRNFSRTAGGAESYAIAIAAELAQRHELHVFCQETDQPVAGATYHLIWRPCRRPRWVNVIFYAVATWWHTRAGFDVVHSHEHVFHGQVQTLHVQPVAKGIWGARTGWRKVVRWLSVLTSPRRLTYCWLEWARMRIQPGRQLVFASSPLMADFEHFYPGIEPISHTIAPGVARPEPPLERAACRQALGWAQTQTRLLFVANDYARKGLDALLSALQLLPAQVVLTVVGQTRQLSQFQALVDRLGLRDRVQFLGPRHDIDTLMAASDVLVHPTLEDSFGMVVLEAMAHGLPVVVSAAPYCGLSAELLHGRDALMLSDPKDAPTMARLVQDVLDHAGLRARLVEGGFEQARRRSWADAALKYEKIFSA